MSTPVASSARAALFRLEVADALRSRWVIFTAVAYALVFGAFVWLGLRESSVLGFTGLSRVVLNASNAVVIVLPLVSLVATHQSVVRARSTGFFELLLAQPVRRDDWLAATVAARLLVIVGPLVVLLLATLVVGVLSGERALAPLVARCLLVVTSLSVGFVGVGVLVSSAARSTERATVYALVAWLGAAVLHDFGLIGVLLRWRLSPPAVFALAALNPVESSRIAILSGIDPELSVLGPVGFWLANTLGSQWGLAVGVVWPALVGAVALFVARLNLRRRDLVG
jgi:ABC-2 type transport system permease protein